MGEEEVKKVWSRLWFFFFDKFLVVFDGLEILICIFVVLFFGGLGLQEGS